MSTSSAALPKTVLVGAGGHAKVVIDLMRAAKAYELVGLIDAQPKGTLINGVQVIGADDDLMMLRREGITHAHVAIGHNARRLALSRQLQDMGFQLANAISPVAVLSESVRLGQGIAIMAGAVVNADSMLADACILNTRASIDHDCTIFEGAHVAPGCALAGNVTIGRLAFVGVGTSIIPGMKVGEAALIGAGSCVVCDIPAEAKAYGVPARVVANTSRPGS